MEKPRALSEKRGDKQMCEWNIQNFLPASKNLLNLKSLILQSLSVLAPYRNRYHGYEGLLGYRVDVGTFST